MKLAAVQTTFEPPLCSARERGGLPRREQQFIGFSKKKEEKKVGTHRSRSQRESGKTGCLSQFFRGTLREIPLILGDPQYNLPLFVTLYG